MIFLDSRYSDGTVFKARDARTRTFELTVFRTFPTDTASFFWYEWVQGDRVDVLASKFLGTPSLWWRLMDVNPEIINPLSISPGTHLRIPNA